MGLFHHQNEQYKNLSPEDQRILDEAHGKLNDQDKQLVKESYTQQNNPNHPANPQHPDHGKFKEGMSKISHKLGNAAIFGFGATAGADLFSSIF